MVNCYILVAYFAALAIAAPRAEVEVVQIRQVLKRQDLSSFDLGSFSSLDLGSLSSLLPTLESIPSIDINTLIPSACQAPSDLPEPPTPPANVVSALATWTNACEIPSLTGQAEKDYSSFQSAYSEWSDENSPKLISWVSAMKTACPGLGSDIPDYVTMNPTDSAAIGSFLASNTLGLSQLSCPGGTKETAKGGSSGAAPQPTAFAAAGVLAGVAGLVAVL